MLLPSGPAELSNAVRVLLLEDERTCAEVVAQYLRNVRGLELRLDCATTLAEARAHLARGAYDLLIVDLHLPDSKGLATLDAMQGSNALVIVITGDGESDLREAVLARGAYDFVHKSQLSRTPFEQLVRLAAVQADTVRSLRRSQARLQAIVDTEPECVKLLDRQGNLLEMNPAGLRMIEAESLDAVRGHCVFPLVAPAHRDAFRALVERAADGGEGSLEFEVIGLKGTRSWLETRAVPLRDEASGERLVLGITRDVTAQRRAERSQKESEERFRLALDNSADMIVLIDRATMRFIDCNNTVCRLTGYSREELLAMKPWELLPVTREQLEEAYDRQIADPSQSAGLRSYYRCKDGSQLPFESRRQVLRSGDSWIITAISRDVRERIAADQALRESEERFRSLVELSSDFYWETDAEHRLIHTTHDLKYRPASDPVIGRARWELPSVHPDAAGWEAHRALLAARKAFYDFEIARIDPDGVRRHLAISGEPMLGAAGEFLGYRGVGRDITERRREERLIDLEHAIARALTGAWSVSGALRAVIRALCESEGWPVGRYLVADEQAGVLRLREAWGSDDPAVQVFIARARARLYRRGEGLSGWVWQHGKPLSVADTREDPRSTSAATSHGDVGMGGGAFVFPVIFEGKTIGVLSFSSTQKREPDERLMKTIHVIGSQIGQFLQRKQAEVALSESEARFRETFELAATGIAHVSLDGRFLRVNRRLCEMLGYAEAELAGRSVKDLSHPDDRDVTDAERERMRSGELASARFEKRYFRKDGSTLWVALTVALAHDAGGVPLHEISVLEDITERKEREAALQRFRTALDSSADMVFLFRLRDGTLLDFNETVCAMLGYTRDELLALRASDMRTDTTPESLRAEIAALLGSPSRSNTANTEYRRKDGSTFPVESRRSIIDTPQGRVLVVNSRDLSERRSAEKRRATQARYQKKIARLGQGALAKRDAAELLEQAVQGVLEGLGRGAVAYVERGATPGEVVLKRVDGLAEVVQDAQPLIVNPPWSEGEPLPFAWAGRYQAAAIVPVPGDHGARGALCALAEQRRAFGPEELRFLDAAASMVSAALHRLDSEARLAYLAQFDPLTGLPNRALLSDRFTQTIVLARRRGVPLGVLFIDLDDFKLVNDSQGHAAGDELLKETARRLLGSVRQGDTVARISGDEFAVILGDLARADDAALVAQKIIDRLGQAFAIRDQEVFVTASIGIATFPADGDDAEALLGAADAAMYRAKQAGRNAFQFFTADINQRTRARAQLGIELRRALERNEFSLAYQPKVILASGESGGAEALLRWNHPERGSVPPLEFIPVLEETGLIVQVGEWVLERACSDLKAWQAAGRKVMPVAVNLSARQFRQQDLDTRIRSIVDAAGIAPSLIELEITESQLMHDPEQGRLRHRLLEPRVPDALSARRAQDRPLVRLARALRRGRRHHRAHHRRHGAYPGLHRGRRGSGVQAASRLPAQAWLRAGPGLPVRGADGGRRLHRPHRPDQAKGEAAAPRQACPQDSQGQDSQGLVRGRT